MSTIYKTSIRKAIARIKIRAAKTHEVLAVTKHLEEALVQEHGKCDMCKRILAELSIELPGAPAQTDQPEKDEMDILPRFGNLMNILKQEVELEKQKMARRRIPSQNDLTRWALKDAVLEYYQGLGLKEDVPVVVNRFDDRLVTELAPDFDVIAEKWLRKLDELYRRDDRYGLIMEELDQARADLDGGMRGSAFEKQLDRYREEFMQKLVR